MADDQLFFRADDLASAEAASKKQGKDLYVIYDKRSKNPTARMYVLSLDAVTQMRDSKNWKRLWEWQIVRKAVTKNTPQKLIPPASLEVDTALLPSQKDRDTTTTTLLVTLVARLTADIKQGRVPNLRIKYSEYRPLTPVYTKEGGEPVGFLQRGPHVLSLIIDDYTDDGKVKGLEYGIVLPTQKGEEDDNEAR